MQEFTPETLKNFISQPRERRDPDLILKNIESKREKNITNTLLQPHIVELDKQIRINLVEIIRYMIKTNKKEDLKKILEEHKNFIENILNELQKI